MCVCIWTFFMYLWSYQIIRLCANVQCHNAMSNGAPARRLHPAPPPLPNSHSYSRAARRPERLGVVFGVASGCPNSRSVFPHDKDARTHTAYFNAAGDSGIEQFHLGRHVLAYCSTLHPATHRPIYPSALQSNLIHRVSTFFKGNSNIFKFKTKFPQKTFNTILNWIYLSV